jgi:hypothetical protein
MANYYWLETSHIYGHTKRSHRRSKGWDQNVALSSTSCTRTKGDTARTAAMAPALSGGGGESRLAAPRPLVGCRAERVVQGPSAEEIRAMLSGQKGWLGLGRGRCCDYMTKKTKNRKNKQWSLLTREEDITGAEKKFVN